MPIGSGVTSKYISVKITSHCNKRLFTSYKEFSLFTVINEGSIVCYLD